MWKQYYHDFYKIYSVLCLPQPNYPRLKWYQNLLTESEKVRSGAQKFTRVRQSYSSLSYKSCFIAFWQGKDYSNKVFLRYAEWIRAFWWKYLIKYHLLMIWSAMYANWRYKGNIQETYTTKNHEIDSCKKDLPNTLRRKGE